MQRVERGHRFLYSTEQEKSIFLVMSRAEEFSLGGASKAPIKLTGSSSPAFYRHEEIKIGKADQKVNSKFKTPRLLIRAIKLRHFGIVS